MTRWRRIDHRVLKVELCSIEVEFGNALAAIVAYEYETSEKYYNFYCSWQTSMRTNNPEENEKHLNWASHIQWNDMERWVVSQIRQVSILLKIVLWTGLRNLTRGAWPSSHKGKCRRSVCWRDKKPDKTKNTTHNVCTKGSTGDPILI